MKSILKPLFALSVLTCALSANAELVVVDANELGDQAALHDTVSDIEWLKLSETSDLSLSYVQGQVGLGGEYEGWSLASMSQVQTLLNTYAPKANLSLNQGGNVRNSDAYTPSLVTMLQLNRTGQFDYDNGSYIVPSYGLHTDGVENYMSGVELRRNADNSFVYEYVFWQHQSGFEADGYSSGAAGVYLVRGHGSADFSDVSAPVSMFAGSLALGMIGAGTRRKKPV